MSNGWAHLPLCALLAMILTAGCSRAQPPASVARSGPLEAISPAGPTIWPFSFTWRGAGADAVVRVRVFDDAERVIYGIEARGNQTPAPEDLRRLLEAGTAYQWRVARVDENGEEADQSEMTPFNMR